MKGDIHSYVLSTSSFLCEIERLRYRQSNIGSQIIIWYPLLFCLYLSSLILQRGLLVLKWKVTSIHTFWVQAVLCAISGSRDIGSIIEGIRFYEEGINLYLTILIAWYPVLFCLNLGSPMLHRKLIVLKTLLWLSPFIWDISQLLTMFISWEINERMPKSYSCIFFGTPCSLR